jgi:hypothetical protein
MTDRLTKQVSLRRRRLCVLGLAVPLLYIGAYIYLIERLSYLTYSATVDSTHGQINWERTFPLRPMFTPLQAVDRRLRPTFWESRASYLWDSKRGWIQQGGNPVPPQE